MGPIRELRLQWDLRHPHAVTIKSPVLDASHEYAEYLLAIRCVCGSFTEKADAEAV